MNNRPKISKFDGCSKNQAMKFDDVSYNEMINSLFGRFKSFQSAGKDGYKPGLDRMLFLDQLSGHPHRKYPVIHVAGTNGKGSVCNMLASVLASSGLRVGLYTSPHITDFRERMRVIEDAAGARMISKQDVWNYVEKFGETFDNLGLSFFEITTSMAFGWFTQEGVDVAVVETGLGGRMDSTNIVEPVLSVITNIGLDHCDILGSTLGEIAFEKAGIIKPGVSVVVGESDPETDPIFERKVLYTNASGLIMDRGGVVSRFLRFADRTEPRLWDRAEEILSSMDLKGSYQRKNLRTVLCALDSLRGSFPLGDDDKVVDALVRTASRTGFPARWETLCTSPRVICDIGHNAHGLKYNFSQLEGMLGNGECSDVIMVYGSVSDKDVDAVLDLVPSGIDVIFTNAKGARALPASEVRARYEASCVRRGIAPCETRVVPEVADAVRLSLELARGLALPLIYIGGSTYVVAEAVPLFR